VLYIEGVISLIDILPEFSFAEAWIATVLEGHKTGWSYSVDRMLQLLEITKFSGTTMAGKNNESLLGKTMDALAHYSIILSSEELVLVDIQGSS